MKLLLVLVSIIAVFSADGRDSSNNQAVLQATNEDQLLLEGTGRQRKVPSSVEDGHEDEIQDSAEQEHHLKEEKEQQKRNLKRSRCKARNSCVVMGGFCVTNATLCSGRLVPEGCKRLNCQCCVPGTIEARFDNFEKELHFFNVRMNNSDMNLQSEMQSLKENMHSEMQSLKESANISYTDLSVDFQSLKDNINTEMQSLKDNANISNSDLSEDLQSLKDNMNSGMQSLNDNANISNSDLSEDLQSLKDNMNTALTNLTSKMDSLNAFKGSLILPTKTTTKMSWSDSIKHCHDMNAHPFIPRTSEDIQLYKSVSLELGNHIWLPASDTTQEGTLKWWNGEDAPSSDPGLVWWGGVYMQWNGASSDCVFYSGGHTGAYMYPCSSRFYPMICTM